MAPNGEMLLVGSYPRNTYKQAAKPPRLSTAEGLQRAVSDLSAELSKEAIDAKLPPISEVVDAKCECCGMSEECTPEYIRRVRDKFCGRWICGLCSEAVKEEVEKKGVTKEEAVGAHMSMCTRFSRFGRTHPVLYQAEAMREILKRCSSRSKSTSPREKDSAAPKKGGITRSSSCIPAITKEMNERMTSSPHY